LCCTDRILFHHNSRRRDYDWPPNDDCPGCDGSRLSCDHRWRGSVLVNVSFTLIGRSTGIGSYGSIGGRCRRAAPLIEGSLLMGPA